MEEAHSKRPAEAIALYDALVNAKQTSPAVRAQALLNRALAYSSLKDDAKAIADLEVVVTLPGVSENIVRAARDQLVRVRQRVERGRTRTEAQGSARAS
jgi:hypothetical protein